MNQRLKELEKQATTIEYGVDNGFDRVTFDKEKFARLIVQDIIGIVEGYCETSPEIYGLPLDILEHFDMELNDDQV